jgi:hypothetical protein
VGEKNRELPQLLKCGKLASANKKQKERISPLLMPILPPGICLPAGMLPEVSTFRVAFDDAESQLLILRIGTARLCLLPTIRSYLPASSEQ